MRFLVLTMILLALACSNDAASDAGLDAGRTERDASTIDAPGSDAPAGDASTRDAPPLDVPDIPVALPGFIEGVEPETQSNHPPMIDGNGYLYRVTETESSDGNNPRMMRSIDNGATWAEVDAGNRPSARDLEGCWQLQLGTAIYLTVAANNNVWFTRFNTSDAPDRPDQWVIDEEVVDELGNSGGVVQFSSVSPTSDGRFWMFYSGTVRSRRQEIQYRRRGADGTWSGAEILGDAAGSWTGPRGIAGAGDVTHVLYTDYENAELYWRTLSDEGVLSSPTRVDVAGLSSERIPHTNAVLYSAGGSEVITVAWADDSGELWSAQIVGSEVQAPERITADAVLENPSVALSDGTVAHLALDGTTVHVLWTDLASGDVLHASRPHGGSWSAPEIAWDSGDNVAWWVYANVYVRAGRRRLGFTYDVGEHADDVGFIEYDELNLD